MLKKITAVLLAMAMVLSLVIIVAAAEDSEQPQDTNIYFDVNSAGWTNFGKVAFYVYEVGGGELAPWGSWKKISGTDQGDGIWAYDATKYNLQDGVQYGIIFVGTTSNMQTYNLLFDTTCLGDTAYCDGTEYENPEDSTKTAQAAFWKNHDAAEFGPELKISSIGTVVGTCCAANTTPYQMFADFLKNTLNNARMHSEKDDQTLLDDIAAALGLSQADVAQAIAETGVEVDWTPSEQPTEPKPTEPKPATPDEPTTPSEPAPTVPAPTEPGPKKGDADMDGAVTVFDVTVIQRWLAEMEDEANIDLALADVDGDGKVTIFDATRIQRYLAGMCDIDGNPITVPDAVA